jgi:hypothetical protein
MGIYIYIYPTVLELDFRAVKYVFFPRRDLNPHHIGFATLLKYMYINISYFYSPTKNTCNTHKHTHTHTHIYIPRFALREKVTLRFVFCFLKMSHALNLNINWRSTSFIHLSYSLWFLLYIVLEWPNVNRRN